MRLATSKIYIVQYRTLPPRITSEMLIEASRATRYNEACHFCSLKGSPFRIKVEN